MSKRLIYLLIGCVTWYHGQATRISGKVFTDKSLPLPFSSVLVKNLGTGTTANSQGEYHLDLPPGTYTLICQHIGFSREEKQIEVGNEPLTVHFILKEVSLSLQEVIVRSDAEDPAYAIIREAIRHRPEYRKEVKSYQCEAYIKGQIRLRKYPRTFFGQRIELEDPDTSANKIIFLSETVARYTFNNPDKEKIEVLSTRVSGQSNGFGFGNPLIVSFYTNNIQLGRTFNPRGFVSPIADGALDFYRYKYRGAFFEDGRQISRIEVIPKRSWEPLFRGYIQIVENEWRIHSLQLTLVKQSQLEFIDSLTIEQLYMPQEGGRWMLNSQVIYPSVKLFGFDAYGYFTTHFNDYKIEPVLDRKFFDRTILKYDKISNKRSSAYWDSIRPVPLLTDEVADFRRKDSLEQLRSDPDYLDSLDRRQNRPTPVGLILNGQTLFSRKSKMEYQYDPLLKSVSFNTVEGWVAQLSGTITKTFDGRKAVSLTPVLRYGFTNTHVNAFLVGNYRFGKKYMNDLKLSGGKRVFQFNNTNPIPSLMNTISTLFSGYNYMKIYEGWFLSGRYAWGVGGGFTLEAGLNFQHRIPLENTDTLRMWGKDENLSNLTPNYPVEISNQNIETHEALVASFTVKYRPGTKYIELPDRKINLGSRYPLVTLTYARGINKFFGSDIEYDRWRATVQDDINFKIAGELRFNLVAGGFLSKNIVNLPDYQHFDGNRVRLATPYLNSFQLAPYYENSNMEDFFAIAHIEHHFNGLLTNKVPLIKRLNLRLVGGTNAFYVNRKSYYYEFVVGIDNVLKILRFDYAFAFNQDGFFDSGIKIGIKSFSTLFSDY